MHKHLLNISTISIHQTGLIWTTAKLKTRKFTLFRNRSISPCLGDMLLFRNYMHITAINAHQKIKEQIPLILNEE